MTERRTFDAFEQRIAGELERYVAPATDPRTARDIAATAMRPRGLVVRARNLSRSRRLLLLGLAAALLLPAAYLGALSLRPSVPDLITGYVSIFVRRVEGPEPGVSVFAVRPDGAEVLVRHVPDSVVPGGAKLTEQYGTVSETGWLALASEQRPWPMILVDLRDPTSTPWVVGASTGGIGPRWGPTGLIAADAGGNGSQVVIADPETRATRLIGMHGGLVGGGPSIVWTADGKGIVGSTGGEAYQVVPIDGGAPQPTVGDVFDRSGGYGTGMANLRICDPGMNCPGGDDGRIERMERDGSARTIWQQQGRDRALAASFGSRPDEYWLTVEHDSGRQVALVHLHDGRTDDVARLNRRADWQYVAAPVPAGNSSMMVVWVYVGDRAAAAVVPFSGAAPTFHAGQFAGFVDGSASALLATGKWVAPAETLTTAGQVYRLPTVDELIAAEQRLNPSHVVLGKASRDAVEGDKAVRTFEVARDLPGAGNVYLDCYGPSSVTVTSGNQSATSPCLQAGTYEFLIDASSPIIVRASGDTSWRVVIYTF